MTDRNVNCVTYPHSRSYGHSAVKGAAYRAGENIRERGRGDDPQPKIHRFAGRAADVRETFILLPDGAPDWARALAGNVSALRAELWNRVEEFETHSKARVAREMQLGLAYELTRAEQKQLLTAFVKREVVSRGFAADVCIHDYGRTIPSMGATDKDKADLREWADRGLPFLSRAEAQGVEIEHVVEIRRADQVTGYKHYQPHAHVYITPRDFVDGGFADNKYAGRYFNKSETAKEWRYEWPKAQNAVLEANGIEARVHATSEAERAHRETNFRAQSQDKTTYEMDRREEALTPEERANHREAKRADELRRDFNREHNETIRLAEREARNDDHMDQRHSGEQHRISLWWRNMSQRFHVWRDDHRETASEWRERFERIRHRIAGILSWHDRTGSQVRNDNDRINQEPDR